MRRQSVNTLAPDEVYNYQRQYPKLPSISAPDGGLYEPDQGYDGYPSQQQQLSGQHGQQVPLHQTTDLASIILQVIVLVTLATFAGLLRFGHAFHFWRRSELCGEPIQKFAFPYFKESPEVLKNVTIHVSPAGLYVAVFLIPILLMLGSELAQTMADTTGQHANGFVFCHGAYRIPYRVLRLLRFLSAYMIGLFAASITSDAWKRISGYPRPYFLSVCENDTVIVGPRIIQDVLPPFCSFSYSTGSQVISTCKNEASEDLKEARMSFPSTQATLAFYATAFCIWYVNHVISRRGNILKPVLSIVLGILAMLESYSLIQSYHNHWEDVFVGCLLGCAAGISAVRWQLAGRTDDPSLASVDVIDNSGRRPTLAVYPQSEYDQYGPDRIEIPINQPQQWPPRAPLHRSTSQYSIFQRQESYTPPGTSGRRMSLVTNQRPRATPRPSFAMMPPLNEASPRESLNSAGVPAIRVSDHSELRHPRRHSVASGPRSDGHYV